MPKYNVNSTFHVSKRLTFAIHLLYRIGARIDCGCAYELSILTQDSTQGTLESIL
jgi:hypothetical protein